MDCEFPAGLRQPAGHYRFGLDALLLGAFGNYLLQGMTQGTKIRKAAEIGCGCGAALLGLSLLTDGMEYLGLDRSPEMIEAARVNAILLDRKNMFFYGTDLEYCHKDPALASWHRHCSLVLANPPWRNPAETTRSASSARSTALWAQPDTMKIFCMAARELLSYRGLFACILPPEALPQFCEIGGKYDLGLRLIRPVANMIGQCAIRVLLACKKNAQAQPRVDYPLILRDEHGPTTELVRLAPWLAKNIRGTQDINL